MTNNLDKQKMIEFANKCREKFIPVVREKTADLLSDLICKNSPKKILELGTAVGYSGTIMLSSCKTSHLTTVELNQNFCDEAKKTFEEHNLLDRVEIVNDDILNFLENETQRILSLQAKNIDIENEKYNFIFLDGPKGQYLKYYQYLKQLIVKNGIIFCDDVLYFGMVFDDSKVIHKKITIVRNLREFLTIAQNDKDFESELIEMEDGILVLKKK